MQFLYAIEKVPSINDQRVKDACLSYAFDKDTLMSQREMSSGGPGGGRCVIFSACDANKCYYKPDEQIWQKSNNGKFWIGFYKDEPPIPEDLAKEPQLAGHQVTLEDGKEYLIPVARQFTGGSVLPKSLVLGAKGEIIEKQLPRFAQFWSRVEKLWDDFLIINKINTDPEAQLQLAMADRLSLAAEAMGFNYRIGINELNVLQILTTENISMITAAILDVPTMIAAMKEIKKKEAQIEDAPTPNSGSED